MKLFIDTANLDEIRQASELGVLDGVTTNPTLVAKEGVDFQNAAEGDLPDCQRAGVGRGGQHGHRGDDPRGQQPGQSGRGTLSSSCRRRRRG